MESAFKSVFNCELSLVVNDCFVHVVEIVVLKSVEMLDEFITLWYNDIEFLLKLSESLLVLAEIFPDH